VYLAGETEVFAMAIQLGLLSGEDEDREGDNSTWPSLPESVRCDLRERFADLLIAVVVSISKEERSHDLDKDRAEAPGA
jgi:hypothetical protein